MKKVKRWRGERGNRERMRVILEGAWKIEGRMYGGRDDGPRRGKKSAGRGRGRCMDKMQARRSYMRAGDGSREQRGGSKRKEREG